MGFAKRRRSIIMAGKWRWATFLAGACLCVAGSIGRADAQVPGLSTPQKQVISFTFGLGSSELNERYGQNAASMSKFDKLIHQLVETPSAHIDSIVVTSYSSTAEQLGSVEVAERRIDAVKAYLEPVIRGSQLRQPVVVTGNVVARNNVIMPEQLFDMLKRTTVTVYLNGVLVAKSGTTTRSAGSAEEEERRYVSPFGGEDIFGRGGKRETSAVERKIVEAEPQVVPMVRIRPAEQPPVAKTTGKNTLDSDLQRYIDSLTVNSKSRELPEAPGVAVAGETDNKVITPPAEPVITEEVPCPEDRDPRIDDLIRRLLAEESTVHVAPAVDTGHVSEPKKAEVVELEIIGEPEMVQEVADARKIKIKPVKEQRVKPVKPVKTPHEPMVLIRPLVSVKTNLAYWATVAANVEVEFYFAKRWSAAVEGVYTDWNMNLYKKHYAVNEISPEIRYWTSRKAGQYRGLYIGVYGHVGQFDYMFKNEATGNTGDYYGGGISLGGYLPFTRHFGIELGLRGGFVHAGDFDRYYYDAPHYMFKSSHSANYIGLTGAKVSLVYRFGLGNTGRK